LILSETKFFYICPLKGAHLFQLLNEEPKHREQLGRGECVRRAYRRHHPGPAEIRRTERLHTIDVLRAYL
jgi:hypothetical protein